jgi:predicted enzyme related to lactoylglutathione lyase
MELKFNGVALFTRDLPKVAGFYQKTLGLTAFDIEGSMAMFRGPGETAYVSIFDSSQYGPAEGEQPAEIWFTTDDPDAAHDELKRAGATIVSEPQDFPYGRSFMVRDPQGYRISIYRPAAVPA